MGGPRDDATTKAVRDAFPGVYVANGAYTAETAAARIDAGRADAVAFGELFIANPDLPARIRQGGPYNEPDPATYYGGDAKGYTDYPTLG
jgi:N-ethylmaleimide reductase